MRIAFDMSATEVSDALAYDMSRDDLLNLICELDLRCADAGFTEALIKRLMESIRGDLDRDQYEKLVAELARIGGDA